MQKIRRNFTLYIFVLSTIKSLINIELIIIKQVSEKYSNIYVIKYSVQ